MSQPIIHVTGKLQDGQIAHLFNTIKEKMGFSAGQFMYGVVPIPFDNVSESIGDGDGYVLTLAQISIEGKRLVVHYRRGTSGLDSQGQININTRIPSPYFDEVIIVPNPQQLPTIQECFTLEETISDYIKIHLPQGATSGAEGAIQLLQTEMAALTNLHRKMLSDTQTQKENLEDEYRKKRESLDTETRKQKGELDEHRDKENSRIIALKEEIEQARKQLDDRDHMHVRRQLRHQIGEEIKARVSGTLVPTRSIWVNWAVLVFAIVCAGAAGVFAWVSLAAFADLLAPAQDPSAQQIADVHLIAWMLAIRGTVASAVALGFLVYALSWLRKTYLDDVKVSNELQRYALDINRASWTIETIMEMTTKEGRVLPDRWIEAVCRGLFQNAEGAKTNVTPLEAWGTLLNLSGRAEIGPDGPKLEFKKGQTKKAATGPGKD